MSKYGQHIRPRTWHWPHPQLRTVAATAAVCLVAASCLAILSDARRDVARAERRINALEAQTEKAEQDTEDLWSIVIGLQPPSERAHETKPEPSETWYMQPVPDRTMPPEQPNRSRPRRTLTPMPSWHPVQPTLRPAAAPAPQPSAKPEPTPSPTESDPCPAATVGEVPCALESLPSPTPSPSIGATP